MNSVYDLITMRKNKKMFWVSPYDNVASAIQKMSDNKIEALAVLDNEEIVGVFSEHEYTGKLLQYEKSVFLTPIFEVMITKVIYVTPDYLLEECLAIMTKNHIRYLPVLDNGKLVDLIAIEDVVNALLQNKDFIISNLSQYLSGSPTFNIETQKPYVVRELVLDKSGGKQGESLEKKLFITA